jgi:outer membrane protein OmpA-like peptidoglycan-associated protein
VPQSFIYSFEIKGGASSFKTIRSTVYFEPGSSKLLVAEQWRILKLIGKVAPKVTAGAIFGYVQENGEIANYQKLSTARARVLAKFLKKHGVTARLQTQGKGALNPNPSARKVTFTVRYTK